jgi:hypothetical protein
MSNVGGDRAVFVFDPDASYAMVDQIRKARVMPTPGLRYVASVSGRWKVFKVMSFDGLADVPKRLDAAGDPETAVSFRGAKIRRSTYRKHTTLVRIDTDVPDPSHLIDDIGTVIATGKGDPVEVDVVAGPFDLLACIVDDNEDSIEEKIVAIRRIKGVKRTMSLRVFDYVSTSPNAPARHRVRPA